MTNQEYHSRTELSCSNIKTLLKNPYEYVTGFRKEATKAMDFGSCVHKLVLEPLDFEKEFAVSPKYNLRTNEGKTSYQSFIDTNIGKIIMNEDDFENAKHCATIAEAIAGKFFKGGKAEESYFSELEGVGVRCRPDYYIEELGIVVDVKTTQDASPAGFNRSVANFGYHIQEAFYTDVLRSLDKKVNKFVFVAIETKEPFMIGIYELSHEYVDLGRNGYKRGIEIYKNLDQYTAPIYKNGTSIVHTLVPPTYLFYQEGENA